MYSGETPSSFNDSVEALLTRVECRRLILPADRAEAYALRYYSYLREGAIEPASVCSLSDAFDDLPHQHLFGFYIAGRLVSTLRLGVATSECRDIAANLVFGDVLESYFAQKRVLLDPTRFVIDEASAKLYPKLAYVTLRVAWLATEHFDVDYTLASVRLEHQAFYKRFYGHVVVCPPRRYLTLTKPLSLMVLDFRPMREKGLRRYPFLRSSADERRQLFGSVLAPGSGAAVLIPRAVTADDQPASPVLNQIFAHAPTKRG